VPNPNVGLDVDGVVVRGPDHHRAEVVEVQTGRLIVLQEFGLAAVVADVSHL
jgi:hypothetical protein